MITKSHFGRMQSPLAGPAWQLRSLGGGYLGTALLPGLPILLGLAICWACQARSPLGSGVRNRMEGVVFSLWPTRKGIRPRGLGKKPDPTPSLFYTVLSLQARRKLTYPQFFRGAGKNRRSLRSAFVV